MPQEPSNKYQLYIDEPRLRMTVAGRTIVRIVSYISYLVFGVVTITLLLSYDVRPLFYLGLFFLLILVDLIIHKGQADMPIYELPKNGRINLAELLRPSAFTVIERATDVSIITQKSFLFELALRLLDRKEIMNGLRRLDVKPEELRQKISAALAEPAKPGDGTAEDCLAHAQFLITYAFNEAMIAGHEFIEVTDLFSALPRMQDEELDAIFLLFSVDPGDLQRALLLGSLAAPKGIFGRLPDALGSFAPERRHRIKHRIMNRAWTARPTPLLDRFGIDLTDLARESQIGFLIGHDAEYERMIETLARPMNPNALLIGEPGIGKEAIVHHLALALVKDHVTHGLFDKRLVQLQLQNLVAGAPTEELESRLKQIVEEIYMADNVILYIPDIHNLVRTSGTAYLSAADALMPVIMANNFPIVGSTYPREFKQLVEPRSDFAGIFETIEVKEVSEPEAEHILIYQSVLLEKKTHITISFGAVKRAVLLAKKYFHNRFLPASAEELLKSALVDAERRGEKLVTPERVTAVAEEKVNVPMHEAEADEADRLLNMEKIIHERLVGQDEAVIAVSQALREYRSGLTRKGGPIASFLFVGPTGVGKTELAKLLAEIQFGSEAMMVRFDMTEYQDKQSFYRFIGSPDGQVRGALTDAVLEKPYCLILLDEFEKAYPDILNLFLQVFDDGRLTDTIGRTVDFSNTIIIATSNAHSDIINEALSKGESMGDIGDYVKSRLVDVFKPELLNRFSNVIIFKNLEPHDLPQIVEMNLKGLEEAAKQQGIVLTFAPEAVIAIAKLGYDPQFGARPLRRVIDSRVRAPLAEAMLSKKVSKGGHITCVFEGDKFDFVSR